MQHAKKTLRYYRALPYSRRSEGISDDGPRPYWVAWIEELPGCKTDGATHAEAMLNLDAAFDDYIEAMLEFGSHIPTPMGISGEGSEGPEPAEPVRALRSEGAASLGADLLRWEQDSTQTTATMLAATSR